LRRKLSWLPHIGSLSPGSLEKRARESEIRVGQTGFLTPCLLPKAPPHNLPNKRRTSQWLRGPEGHLKEFPYGDNLQPLCEQVNYPMHSSERPAGAGRVFLLPPASRESRSSLLLQRRRGRVRAAPRPIGKQRPSGRKGLSLRQLGAPLRKLAEGRKPIDPPSETGGHSHPHSGNGLLS